MSSLRIFFILLIFVIIGSGFFIFKQTSQKPTRSAELLPTLSQTSTPSPEVKGTKVKYPQDFTIVLLGDSMTERLGNSDEIRSYLSKYYPNKTVEVLNYGFGSTNILTVPDRLTKKTQYFREFRPILDIEFNMIILESFGHNPLSQYSLAQGLATQNKALDESIDLIKKSNPNAKIVFLATIAPNSKSYALKQAELTPKVRAQWASERVAYIKNHIAYAKSHNIPIINVYQKSLQKDGDGNPLYVDPNDNIHPSANGIYLISQEIANFITQQNYPQFTN